MHATHGIAFPHRRRRGSPSPGTGNPSVRAWAVGERQRALARIPATLATCSPVRRSRRAGTTTIDHAAATSHDLRVQLFTNRRREQFGVGQSVDLPRRPGGSARCRRRADLRRLRAPPHPRRRSWRTRLAAVRFHMPTKPDSRRTMYPRRTERRSAAGRWPERGTGGLRHDGSRTLRARGLGVDRSRPTTRVARAAPGTGRWLCLRRRRAPHRTNCGLRTPRPAWQSPRPR